MKNEYLMLRKLNYKFMSMDLFARETHEIILVKFSIFNQNWESKSNLWIFRFFFFNFVRNYFNIYRIVWPIDK